MTAEKDAKGPPEETTRSLPSAVAIQSPGVVRIHWRFRSPFPDREKAISWTGCGNCQVTAQMAPAARRSTRIVAVPGAWTGAGGGAVTGGAWAHETARTRARRRDGAWGSSTARRERSLRSEDGG